MAIGKHLGEAIATFCEVNQAKGVNFTYQNFKKVAPKTTIYRIVKFQDERSAKLLPQETIIKMFDNLKEKVYKASREKVSSHCCNQKRSKIENSCDLK